MGAGGEGGGMEEERAGTSNGEADGQERSRGSWKTRRGIREERHSNKHCLLGTYTSQTHFINTTPLCDYYHFLDEKSHATQEVE